MGAVVIILLFVLLIYSGISIAMRAPDKFGCMLVIGLVAQIGWQALLNIAVVTNSIPNTGISLPFFQRRRYGSYHAARSDGRHSERFPLLPPRLTLQADF